MWPSSAKVAPRMKFPPPTTIANSTPEWQTSTHCCAMFSISDASMPNPPSWHIPSPEIFNNTRLYFGLVSAAFPGFGIGLGVVRVWADFVNRPNLAARRSPDLHVDRRGGHPHNVTHAPPQRPPPRPRRPRRRVPTLRRPG